jgi:hypothetical protein
VAPNEAEGRALSGRLAMAVVLAAVAAAAAGFPLSTPALVEEWSFRWSLERGQPWISPDVLSTMPTRPLSLLPHALARALAPDSFAGQNVLLLAVLAAKGLAAAALLARIIPGSPAAAAAGAVLVALVPADTSLFQARDLPNHVSVFLTLLSLLFYARALERPTPPGLAAMAACQALALGIYESPFPLLLGAPLVFRALSGGRRPTRRLLAVWYAVPLALAARAVFAATRSGNYVANLFAASSEPPFTRAWRSLEALGRMSARQFTAPFTVGARAAAALGAPDLLLAALASAVTALLLWRAGTKIAGATLRRAGAGLALLALGALPYTIAPALRNDVNRVHLLAAVGAGIVLGALVSRLPARSGAVAAAAFVLLAVLSARSRRGSTLADARRVGRLVRELAEGAPSPAKGALILLIDAEGPPLVPTVLGLTLTDVHLADALRVVHRRADILLYVLGRELHSPWNGRPVPGPDGVTVKWTSGRTLLVPYGNVVAFRERPDGSVFRLEALPKDLFSFERASEYDPVTAGGSGPPPARLATLVPVAPAP